MKPKRPLLSGPFLLIFILAVLLTACSGEGNGIKINKEFTITCEVYYRHNQGDPLTPAPVLTFSEGSAQKYLVFDDMTFNARFQEDEYEGHALYVTITGIEETDEYSRQLYQFDSQNPPENQFVGGHGFTGLNYVYHPDSHSEMQYYCLID